MKKKLIVDLDYVICYPGFLSILNSFLGTSYKESDFNEYIIDPIIGSEEKIQEFYKYYLEKDGYDKAVLIENAKETLEKLSNTYDIYLCSACVMFGLERDSAKLFADKFKYIMKELPFLDPEKIIFTNSKNIFEADVQIDDRLPNLMGNIKLKILFSAYHNMSVTNEELAKNDVIRASSWKEIGNMLSL